MNALPSNVVDFKIPKRKPKVVEKEQPPDQRRMTIMPIRAITDKGMTDHAFRIFALVCSYSNRAGITWVSQARLAQDTGTSRQAVSKQLIKLRALGYIETVSKAFKGVKPDTIRVIFDPTIDAETAIALTSSIEDTRPPEMIREQQKELDNTVYFENLKRVQEMISGVLKPMNPLPKEYQMPKQQDTITVAKMKKQIAQHKQKTAAYATTEVAQPAQIIGTHTQPYTQPQEVAQYEEERVKAVIYKVFNKHSVSSVQPLSNLKLSDAELTSICDTLSNRYQSEGVAVPASDDQLIYDLLMISTDLLEAGAYTTHSKVATGSDHA